MGKKYNSFVAVGADKLLDIEHDLEVASGEIIAYNVEPKALLRKERRFTTGSTPITRETTIQITGGPDSQGTGDCQVTTGSELSRYDVYGKLEEFVAEVQAEITRAGGPA